MHEILSEIPVRIPVFFRFASERQRIAALSISIVQGFSLSDSSVKYGTRKTGCMLLNLPLIAPRFFQIFEYSPGHLLNEA